MPLVRRALFAAAACGVGALAFARCASRPGADAATCAPLAAAERSACYSRLLSQQLREHGVAQAVATLDVFAAGDPEVALRAHEYAHGIGIEAFARASDVAATFATCGDGYSSGCRHGVVQAYFEAQERVGASDVEALCRPFKGATGSRWLLFQCVHGMGHGLTMLHGHDLPRALTDCDFLTDSWDRESCYGGAFMESVINATTPHHPATRLAAQSHRHSTFRAIDPADPLYPCSVMERRYLHACYQMQTSVILHLNGGDIAAAARVCDRAPPEMRPVCYRSLGRDISAYARRDPRQTAQLCRQGSVAYRPACYVGAVKALVDWTATTDSALAFCRVVAGERGEEDCYHALGEQIASLITLDTARETQCDRTSEPAARSACRRGAGLR